MPERSPAADPVIVAGEARRLAASILGATGASMAPPATGASRLDDLLLDLRRTVHAGETDFIHAEHRRLLTRLQTSGSEIPNAVRPLGRAPGFLAQFDQGFEGLLGAGVLRGVRTRDGVEVSLTGLLGGIPMDPVGAWMLAESVLTSVKARPERPLVLVLESGPALPVMDESAPLSEYLAHLARAIAWARSQAVAVNVWIVGGVDEASFVACSAVAAKVVAFPAALLHVKAVDEDALAATIAAGEPWIAAGMVDELAAAAGRVEIAWNISA